MHDRPTAPSATTDGLLLVDKPAGPSSHDVVAVARRVTGVRQIGHGGTLDPFATGLLLLLVGRATRLLRFVHDEPKRYEATVAFGAETDTEDGGGTVVREAPRPTRAGLLQALAGFHGELQQVPPAYSAKRVGGRRAYDLARAGLDVALPPAAVHVHEIALTDFEGHDGAVSACRMRVACGGGTYIRSLARDLARAVGSAAHLTALRRHGAGAFDLAGAVPYEELRDGHPALLPAIDALVGHPVQPLDAGEIAKVVRGIDVEARVAGDFAALVDPAAATSAQRLVAFAQRRPSERGDRWQPRVVMRDP